MGRRAVRQRAVRQRAEEGCGGRLRVVVGAVVLAVATTATGCGAVAPTTRAGVIDAVAAENEYGNVLGQIGGRYVHVSSILDDPNIDPHTFETSPSVAEEVSAAQLVVENGVGYDSFMDKIEAASPSSTRRVIVVQHLLGLPDDTPNPHLWYDPRTMPAAAAAMATGLAALQPGHAAYFRARLRRFNRSLQPWLRAIAVFRRSHGGATAATTEPVADYTLEAMGVTDLTAFRFQADIMNGVDPSPEDIATESALLTHHAVKVFVYNEQVVDALTSSILTVARKAGVAVVGVYETMPTPGYDYQSWMLAEVDAISRAVTAGASTEHL